MTNKEIKYEITECWVTVDHVLTRLRINNDSDLDAMTLVKERLSMLFDHFKVLADKDEKHTNDLINKTISE